MYLDASVLVALLQDETGSEAAVWVVAKAKTPLVVSDLAAGEVASVLSRLVRTQELTREVALDRLAAFDDWRAEATDPLEIRAQDVRLAERFVRRFELSLRVPDAIHLAICQSRELALATFDEHMSWVAESMGIVTQR